jgi:N-acetyl sugar amidotransferase
MSQILRTRYNLPPEVKFCTKCVISNQRPRISFDAKGVCSACRFAEKKKSMIDWEKRERELVDLCDRYRRKDGQYDVIVPASGGKDSGFVAHQLKFKYDMHPLTVTWAPHIYTDIGWKNFQSFIHSGFDNILGHPNGKVHRTMTQLAFEHLGDPFQPFIYGQKSFPLRMAVKYGVPLVMYGENGEVEYGGDTKNEESPTHNLSDDMIQHYFSGVPADYWSQHGIEKHDLAPYLPPSYEELQKANVQAHFFGYYKKWVPQEIYYYAVENTGFQANPDGRSEGTYSKYASLDDRLDGFHYYLAYIKFGICRCTSDAAHEIRDGHITREEGVALVHKYDGEFPKKYFRDFLEYTQMTEEKFWKVVDGFRSPHLWEKASGEWKLKHKVA